MGALFDLFQFIFQLSQDRQSSIRPSKYTILFLCGIFAAGLVLMVWFYLAEAEKLAYVVLNFLVFITAFALIGIPIIKNLSNGHLAQAESRNQPTVNGRRRLQHRHPLEKHRRFQRIRLSDSKVDSLYLHNYKRRKVR